MPKADVAKGGEGWKGELGAAAVIGRSSPADFSAFDRLLIDVCDHHGPGAKAMPKLDTAPKALKLTPDEASRQFLKIGSGSRLLA